MEIIKYRMIRGMRPEGAPLAGMWDCRLLTSEGEMVVYVSVDYYKRLEKENKVEEVIWDKLRKNFLEQLKIRREKQKIGGGLQLFSLRDIGGGVLCLSDLGKAKP